MPYGYQFETVASIKIIHILLKGLSIAGQASRVPVRDSTTGLPDDH